MGEIGDRDAGLPDDGRFLKELESEFETLQGIHQPVDWAQLDRRAAAPDAHALPETATVGTSKGATAEDAAQEVRPRLTCADVRALVCRKCHVYGTYLRS